MHMADALVSPEVAIVAGVAAISLIVTASKKVAEISREDIVPLMGVMGAFIFAAQMINFTIPGTGSSGHIIGGILLSALMGPWAAFIVLSSVIIIQCLVFADGGMLALGCNIINMAAMSTLVAYPLLYRPIAGASIRPLRIFTASIVSCTIALLLGAGFVTLETELSGVTALPIGKFLLFMLPIHFVIGLCEGVATGGVLSFIASYKPGMLYSQQYKFGDRNGHYSISPRTKRVLILFATLAVIMAVGFIWFASGNPDGLEWSIDKVAGNAVLHPSVKSPIAVMADYSSTLSGVVGGAIVVITLWVFSFLIFRRKRKHNAIGQ